MPALNINIYQLAVADPEVLDWRGSSRSSTRIEVPDWGCVPSAEKKCKLHADKVKFSAYFCHIFEHFCCI